MANEQKTATRMQRAIVCAVCALIIAIFAWSANSGILESTDTHAEDAYYNLLVQGFRAGQLNVKREASPGLSMLSNPYDPVTNEPYVWDPQHFSYEMSYYKGKLYLYFGVTPALVLFWPYVTLTGHYLATKDAVVIFFSLGFLIASGLLYAIWQRYFPKISVWVTASGIVAMGLCIGILETLSSCDVYEVARSCGFMFTMLALAAIWRAWHAPERQVKWLLLASLAYGLAIGARPSLLFGAIILLVPVVRAWYEAGERSSQWRALLLFLAVSVPMALIGTGLMLYNYLRFDNPFEFGWHYQLTSYINNSYQQFSLRYLWFNFRFYFLEPFGWNTHFPFLAVPRLPPQPPGYCGIGRAYSGLLWDYPIVWLALAVPLAWRRKPAGEVSNLNWFISTVFILFLVCGFTMCLFLMGSSLYQLDFLPALMMLAVIGIFGLEATLVGLPAWRRVARCGWSLLLAYSVLFNVLAGVKARAATDFLAGNSVLHIGQTDKAVKYFQRSLALDSEAAGAHSGLGSALLLEGQLDQAINQFQIALELDPSFAEARNNLAYSLLKAGRANDAIIQYQKVLESMPDFPNAHNNLAYCLLQVGRAEDAIAEYKKAVELQPQSATYHCGLANAYLQNGQIDEAMVDYQRALEINPAFPEAHDYLAYCLSRKGRINDAIAEYQKAIKLNPRSIAAQNGLAWILATWPEPSVRNGKEAMALAAKANELSGGNDPQIIRTLAAAYAETGQFPEAVTVAKKALALAGTQSNTALMNELKTEIERYQNGAPWRSTNN